jgi:murein DD-endopeptidase MepM/ murein hydrolase activator NlpD
MRSRNNFAQTVRMTSKLLVTVAAAAVLTACSDSLERFANYGSSNPSNADPVYTASVPKAKRLKSVASSDDAIESSPLVSAPLNRAKRSYDYTDGAQQAKAKQPEAVSTPVEEDVTADIAAEEPAVQSPVITRKKTSTRTGALRVERGMTLYSIARANDVSFKQLARANNLRAPYVLAEGRMLKIPGKSRAVAPDVAEPQVAAVRAVAAPRKVGAYTVASGDTLYSIGRSHNVSPFAIASVNGLKKNSTLSIGQSLRIPGGEAPAIAQSDAPVIEDTPTEKLAEAPVNTDSQIEEIEKPVQIAKAKPVAPLEAKQITEEAPVMSAGALSMRWPANGKVISEFGSKPGGNKNEGINISLPEGTPVRAAESGVVAYAGNELKGYGNLILIRHEGGYVTAYAHSKELTVKRGDTVRRGDVIARAGQTGAVSGTGKRRVSNGPSFLF